MVYAEKIRISRDEADVIASCLTDRGAMDVDEVYWKDVNFLNGYRMVVECIGERDGTAWTHAILYDNRGRAKSCSERETEFWGLWNLRDGDDEYELMIIVDDDNDWSTKQYFNIGEEVIIRDWEDMEQQFGLDSDGNIACPVIFNKDMKYLCGTTFVVRFDTNETNTEIGTVYDKTNARTWHIHSHMVRPYEEPLMEIMNADELSEFLQ